MNLPRRRYSDNLCLDDIASLRNIQTVQELEETKMSAGFPPPGSGPALSKTNLSYILVLHPADLLNIRRALRHILEIVTREFELILDILGRLDVDARVHGNPSHNLFADEVSVRRDGRQPI